MNHDVAYNLNATEQYDAAARYPFIRIMSTAEKASASPLADLPPPRQPWVSAANQTTVVNHVPPTIASFSGVCWFFGRSLADGFTEAERVPLGLISSNVGGTSLRKWTPVTALSRCVTRNVSGDGELYNGMIAPFASLPVSGIVYYQAEADTPSEAPGSRYFNYTCGETQLMSAWRALFDSPDALFSATQLATWCISEPLLLAQMRVDQLLPLTGPRDAFATNADHGFECNIHPPFKQFVGARHARAALALLYQSPTPWRSPSYKSASASSAALGQVDVLLSDVPAGGLALLPPANALYAPAATCASLNAKSPSTCAWASVQFDGGVWVNATVSLRADGGALVLSAVAPPGAKAATATSYGWGAIPMLSAYAKDYDLPVLPWNSTIG